VRFRAAGPPRRRQAPPQGRGSGRAPRRRPRPPGLGQGVGRRPEGRRRDRRLRADRPRPRPHRLAPRRSPSRRGPAPAGSRPPTGAGLHDARRRRGPLRTSRPLHPRHDAPRRRRRRPPPRRRWRRRSPRPRGCARPPRRRPRRDRRLDPGRPSTGEAEASWFRSSSNAAQGARLRAELAATQRAGQVWVSRKVDPTRRSSFEQPAGRRAPWSSSSVARQLAGGPHCRSTR
jgi:hypothetical protein